MTSLRKPAPLLHREIELDFIRGIAILMVMDYHGPWSPFTRIYQFLGLDNLGWNGVDVFFILSGILVGGLLMKEWQVRRGVDCKRFLIRRGLKIWPQYYVFLIVYTVTHHRHLRQAWGDFLNIQNYVPGSIQLTWSLAIEEHTYLFLTALLFVASRTKMRIRTLFFSISGLCLFEIGFRYYLLEHGQLIFLPTHARLDGILYGVLLAMLYHFAPEIFAKLRGAVWLWPCTLVLSVYLLRFMGVPTWALATQHDAATLLAISIVMLLYRPLRAGRRHSAPYRFVAWVGLYSYGIYLWHMSCIQPIERLADHMHVSWPPLTQLVIVICQIALGYATTTLIEFPSLRLRDRIFPRRVDSPVGPPAELEMTAPEVAAAG